MGQRFYVNLGAQPLFVPTAEDVEVDAKHIRESECIFRKRVDPPGRFSWPSSLDDSSLELLRTRLTAGYQDFLTPLATFPGPLTDFSVDDFTASFIPC